MDVILLRNNINVPFTLKHKSIKNSHYLINKTTNKLIFEFFFSKKNVFKSDCDLRKKYFNFYIFYSFEN